MSRPLKIVLAILLLLALGVTWFVAQLFWFSPEIVVSKETTWLTEPLADDGLPDYAAYLLEQGREGVTPENNGAVPFLRAMWPAGLEPRWQRPLCAHLGMEVPAVDGMRGPSEDKSLEERVLAWLEERDEREGPVDGEHAWEIIDWAQSHPWTRAELPPLAEWTDQHAAQLELLHEAATRPKYYSPSPSLLVGPKDSLVQMMLPTVQTMRYAVNCLNLRAYGHLGEGDVAAAWRDCEAIYRLSAHLPGEMLVGILVKIALDQIGDSLTLSILDSPDLTPETARTILAFQKSRAPMAGLAETFDRDERLALVTSVLAFSGQRKQDNYSIDDILEVPELGPLTQASVDWNIVLRVGNEWYDKLARMARQDTRVERQELLEALHRDFDAIDRLATGRIGPALLSRDARSQLVGETLVRIFIPGVHVMLEAMDRSNTHAQLHTIAVALAVHRLEQGEYPESLDALVPEVLDAIPMDPYGNAVVYRRTDEGYLLYSLGGNGTDDGGSNKKFEIYEGYDAEQAVDEPDDANLPLKDQIPEGADDWAIRLPLPKMKPPISGFPHPQE